MRSYYSGLSWPSFVNKVNLSTLEKQRLQENLHDIHLKLKKVDKDG